MTKVVQMDQEAIEALEAQVKNSLSTLVSMGITFGGNPISFSLPSVYSTSHPQTAHSPYYIGKSARSGRVCLVYEESSLPGPENHTG
jgi:hypothetical protein